MIAPDVELLYLHDLSALPGGVWEPGATAMVIPIVMRLSDGAWRLLNLRSETIPTPGWPPDLQPDDL